MLESDRVGVAGNRGDIACARRICPIPSVLPKSGVSVEEAGAALRPRMLLKLQNRGFWEEMLTAERDTDYQISGLFAHL